MGVHMKLRGRVANLREPEDSGVYALRTGELQASRTGIVKTLNIEETAKLLKVHIETVSRLAKTGQLPGAKIGRA